MSKDKALMGTERNGDLPVPVGHGHAKSHASSQRKAHQDHVCLPSPAPG